MLEHAITMTAATATKIAVHAPCVDMALKAIETPSMPEPDANMRAAKLRVRSYRGYFLEDELHNTKATARISRPMGPNISLAASSTP
jgi:hypothetical protein